MASGHLLLVCLCKATLAFDRKLVVLVGRLSVLTGFCPVSCCYKLSSGLVCVLNISGENSVMCVCMCVCMYVYVVFSPQR